MVVKTLATISVITPYIQVLYNLNCQRRSDSLTTLNLHTIYSW